MLHCSKQLGDRRWFLHLHTYAYLCIYWSANRCASHVACGYSDQVMMLSLEVAVANRKHLYCALCHAGWYTQQTF